MCCPVLFLSSKRHDGIAAMIGTEDRTGNSLGLIYGRHLFLDGSTRNQCLVNVFGRMHSINRPNA